MFGSSAPREMIQHFMSAIPTQPDGRMPDTRLFDDPDVAHFNPLSPQVISCSLEQQQQCSAST